jgi:hypothetical protein
MLFEIFVLREAGGQVKDVCGGSAYDVISLEEEIWRMVRHTLGVL